MFGTKRQPTSIREFVGRPTLLVAGFFVCAWIALFTFGTVLILPAWQAGDAETVFMLSLMTLVPLLVVSLFGTIATFGAYGVSRQAARAR